MGNFMAKRHLKLVSSNDCSCDKTFDFTGMMTNCIEYIKNKTISKREKIYVLKDALIKLYRDYEITTGISDIPYYERAELKISEIIQENKIDYYFKLLEKIRKNSLRR